MAENANNLSVKARPTGYMAGIDNAYAGKPDGGTDTSSGVPLNENYATCAVPMDLSRSNLRVGDILLVSNNGKKSVVWATDVGTLPHGDIDLAKSPTLEKNLGIKFKTNSSGTYVSALEGVGDFTVEKIGHVNPRGLGQPNAINEAIKKVNDNPELLAKNDTDIQTGLQASLGQMADNVRLAAERPTINPRTGGYTAKTGPNKKYDENEYQGFLQQMMQSDPELGMFLMIMAVMMGLISGKDISGLFGDKNYGDGRVDEGYGLSADSSKINKKGVLGGASANYSGLELPKQNAGESPSDYYVRAAKSLVGKGEIGNNGGAFVDWLQENAGLAGKNQPYCAAFCSKIYEGTGLFNYTASSLNFAEQGMATNSYKAGTTEGIKKGDLIIFDRGSSTDHKGHIGIVSEVSPDGSIKTIEANKKDTVQEFTYTQQKLKDSRFLGYVDVSHRAEVLKQRGVEIAGAYSAQTPEEKAQAAARAAVPNGLAGVTDKNTPTADKDPAEVLAMHKATLAVADANTGKQNILQAQTPKAPAQSAHL